MVLNLEQKLKAVIGMVKSNQASFNNNEQLDADSENILLGWCLASTRDFSLRKPKFLVKGSQQLYTSSPFNLTADYEFIKVARIKSRVYTTDNSKPFCFFFAFPTKEPSEFDNANYPWDICYVNHRNLGETFGGEGAAEIKVSLVRNSFQYASEINSNLIVMNLVRDSPYNLDINSVSGLGRYNFQGEVNARFYRSKGINGKKE